jgi:hypothetical protein
MCHRYIGTWASFHQMIQKMKHIFLKPCVTIVTIWNEQFRYIQKLVKKIIKLSQTMPHVTIVTIQNG